MEGLLVFGAGVVALGGAQLLLNVSWRARSRRGIPRLLGGTMGWPLEAASALARRSLMGAYLPGKLR